MKAPRQPGLRQWALRLVGLLLLAVLLAQVDLAQVAAVLRRAHPGLLVAAVGLLLPLILLKTLRWQAILGAQGVRYALPPAYLAYFGAIFIGFLTPGRLGEFVKALHVSRDCGVSSARAFASVLADRLYDLALLLLVGSAALLTLAHSGTELLTLAAALALLAVPLALFLNDTAFAALQRLGGRLGRIGRRIFAAESWLAEMRSGLRQLSLRSALLAIGLTVAAYAVFFAQCYLLALALNMSLSYVQVSYAVAIGSLVTLLPLSVSGLGTREAAIIAYLGTAGIAPPLALAFSLLIFATFYLASGALGALAWWLKPAPLDAPRR